MMTTRASRAFPRRQKRRMERVADRALTADALHARVTARAATGHTAKQRRVEGGEVGVAATEAAQAAGSAAAAAAVPPPAGASASATPSTWDRLSESRKAEWAVAATAARERKLVMQKAQDAYNWDKTSAMNAATHLSMLARTLKVAAARVGKEPSGETPDPLDALCDSVLVSAPILVSLIGELDLPGNLSTTADTFGEALLLPLGPEVPGTIAANDDIESHREASEMVTGAMPPTLTFGTDPPPKAAP